MSKRISSHNLLAAFLLAAILVSPLVAFPLSSIASDYIAWNGGHDDCGGKWVYEKEIEYPAFTRYLYKCDKCGDKYEFLKER